MVSRKGQGASVLGLLDHSDSLATQLCDMTTAQTMCTQVSVAEFQGYTNDKTQHSPRGEGTAENRRRESRLLTPLSGCQAEELCPPWSTRNK